MALTLLELKEKLSRVDEISLLEVLNICSEDLVEAFSDRIEDDFERLEEEFQDGNEELE